MKYRQGWAVRIVVFLNTLRAVWSLTQNCSPVYLMILFNPMGYADEITITRILKDCRTIAVVGLSSNPARPSYGVASYMKTQGYRVIPVNPNETNVLGQPAYSSLAAVPGTIDLVNIFRKSEDVLPIVEEAIARGAKAIWMQEGVIHEHAAGRARASGLLVVMDRCWFKEHAARSNRG